MRKLLAFVALLGIYSEVFSMESAEFGCMLDPLAQVFDLFLNNQKERLSHQIIYPLAAVNKSCEKFLFDTAPERSEYLLRKLEELPWVAIFPLPKPDFLNKYGSLVCNKEEKEKGNIKLILDGHYLINDEEEVTTVHGVWDNFSKSVTALPRPFLTPEGNVCCYGWGKDDNRMLWDQRQHLICYCVMPDQKQTFFRCGVWIGRDRYYALSHCAALPHLLRAFVNCPMIHKNADALRHTMFVDLKDVIIPDNYKEYQASGNEFGDIKFDDLPETLKDAIIKRYQECRKK